ncbi:MAG: hypothetical protein GY869_02250, partial [Planctomycetes bacterium]|nr:hypothetical protein [Planctomycetota bacterium]
PNPTNAENVNFVVTFSQPVEGIDQDDFSLFVTGSISGEDVISVSTARDYSSAYTVTVNTGSGDGTIRLDLIDDDSIHNNLDLPLGGEGAGNGDYQGDELYTIDKTRPTVSINQDPTQGDPTPNSPILFRIEFDEAITGFDSSHVTPDGSAEPTEAQIIFINDSTYTAAISGMSRNGKVTAFIDSNLVSDPAGNLNHQSTGTDTVIFFNDPPLVVSISTIDLNPTNAGSVGFRVVFSRPVSGVNPSDFEIIKFEGNIIEEYIQSVSLEAGSDSTVYIVTINTGQGDGELNLILNDDNSITDRLGIPLGGLLIGDGDYNQISGATYLIDKTRPTVTINQDSTQADPTAFSPILFRVEFDEQVQNFSASHVTLSGTAGAENAIISASPGQRIYQISVSGMDTVGTVIADIDSNKVSDLANNLNHQSTSEDNVVYYNPDFPFVTSLACIDDSLTNADSLHYSLIFNEAVSGVDTTDLELITDIPDARIESIEPDNGIRLNSSYTITVFTSSGDDFVDTLQVNLIDDDSIQNDRGVPLGGQGASNGDYQGEVYIIDRIEPVVINVTSPDSNRAYGAGQVLQITVEFNEVVIFTGTPQLVLVTGEENTTTIDCSSNSWSQTLIFNYTVAVGDSSADLDYFSTTSLVLDNGTMWDIAGNDADLTLPEPDSVGSLGYNKDIEIDTIRPGVLNVTSEVDDGSYGSGQVIPIRVEFNDEITVSGTQRNSPQLQLNAGEDVFAE